VEHNHRKRFQIHLSTAVVMMIAAGVILRANIVPSVTQHTYFHWKFQKDLKGSNFYYGWPMDVYSEFDAFSSDSDKLIRGWGKPIPIELAKRVSVNVAVAFAIIFSVWFASEWWIRRRASSGDST